MKKSVEWAIKEIVWNWRLRNRLPKITKKAIELGFIKNEDEINLKQKGTK